MGRNSLSGGFHGERDNGQIIGLYDIKNLNQKIKKSTLLEKDLESIAKALGAVYDSGFRFPDGKYFD